MTACFFDCFSGISGDMVLGALLDAGLPLAELTAGLASLQLPGWSIEPTEVHKAGLRATLAQVRADEHHHHRHYTEIAAMIEGSGIAAPARDMALRVFRRLGEAEAKVHGVTLEEVHFHEVGAVDSIVDIVGACIGLDRLGVTTIHGSALPWTKGSIRTAHGVLPVPAPATAELMRGWPTYQLDVEGELVTPTGAAILTTLATSSAMPSMTVSAVGYGAGRKDLEGRANVLRVVLGDVSGGLEMDTVLEVEANLDDMNPEWLPEAMARVLAAGALDVSVAPMTMKKGRPAWRLAALCDEAKLTVVCEAILRHTTSLGVRYQRLQRLKLRREERQVATPWGSVRLKLGWMGDELVNAAPEYEDCRRLAESSGVPLKQVYAAALSAAQAVP
ncbi:MAG: nickel pincer cofactor biosynthesis protein LarC [Anaerolineae bacterium]